MNPIDEMREYGVSVAAILKKYHPVINRSHMTDNIRSEYNFRIEKNFLSHAQITDQVNFIFKHQKSAFKINCSFSFILRNIETNTLRFYYAHENDQAFELPMTITSLSDLPLFVNKVSKVDIINHVSRDRPSTKWLVFRLCNIRYNVYKLDFTLGAGHVFPEFIRQNRYINTLVSDAQTSKPQNENTCMFRCLAAHAKKSIRNISRLADEYFSKWLIHKKISAPAFKGVDVREIPEIETLFQVSIHVYELKNEKHITLTPVHVSMRKLEASEKVLNLGLWENHLCYIKNIEKLKHCYKCRTCGKLFRHRCRLVVHEKSCTTTQALHFPGGYYKPKPTVFEELEEIGVVIEKEDRFCRHFAVFDFESILQKINTNSDENTQLTALHQPISVCVTSNLPDVREIDFICDPDIDILLKGFVKSLEKIQASMSEMYRNKFLEVFEFLVSEINECDGVLNVQDAETPTEKTSDSDLEDTEARESNIEEAASIAFIQKLKQENSYQKFLRQLCADESDSESIDCDHQSDAQASSSVNVTLPESYASEMDPVVCKHYKSKLVSILQKLLAYCDQLVILGYNSQKYDINIIKNKFAKHLMLPKTQKYISKKNSAYSCITTDKFRFLDVCNFLPVGYNYDCFLKAHEVEIRKFYFPYEFFDCAEKLNNTELPKYEDFYSSLKQCNVLEEEFLEFSKLMKKHKNNTAKVLKIMKLSEPPKTGAEKYIEVQNIWKVKKMSTFRDYLHFYNSADVEGFVLAVQKMLVYYFDQGIDLLKETQSVPGASRKMMFKHSIEHSFKLFSRKHAELYHKFRRNSVGGPAIVYHRMHEAGKTKIRGLIKLAAKILGLDVNALYLYCLCQDMPTGYMIERNWENNFRAEKDERYLLMFYWLEYVAYKKNITVLHYFNNGGKEVYIPPYRCDGFTPPQGARKGVIWEFAGCYWHNHPASVCPITRKIKDPNYHAKQSRYNDLMKKKEFLESNGYQVCIKWECSFNEMRRTNPELREFINKRFKSRYMKYKHQMTEAEILDAVRNDNFFGCIECDIHVPDHLYDKFSEMSPIFCTTEINFNDIGAHMQEFARMHNISQSSRKLLVGGMKAEKILLATPLARWYLQQGLVITKVYQTLEFEKGNKCFAGLCQEITNARREGDKHPDKKLISDSAKLCGNSIYGSSLIQQARFRNHKFIDSKAKAQKLVNNPRFVNVEELDDEIYEFELQKKRINLNTPITIGYFILQYAKLFMLMFYYEFLYVFFKPCDYQLMTMDTDSYYICFSAENPFSLIEPKLREQLCQDWEQWFPREYCSAHKSAFHDSIMAGVRRDFKQCKDCLEAFQYDARQPGLFKLEFSGDKMVCLSSKMYCIEEETEDTTNTKLSCKGVNKNRINDAMAVFDHVLQTQETLSAKNKGFVSKKNQVYTYEQIRSSFTYFYPKREVLSDGVSTKPLSITLRPFVKKSD